MKRQNFLNFFLFIFISMPAFATQYKQFNWQKDSLFLEIKKIYQDSEKEIKRETRYLSESGQFDLNLSIYDFVDQISKKAYRQKNILVLKRLESIRGKVLKEFKIFLTQLVKESKSSNQTKKLLKSLIIHTYSRNKVAIKPDASIFKKYYLKKVFSNKKVYHYNLLAIHPESYTLLDIAKKRFYEPLYVTPELTLITASHIKRKAIKSLKKRFNVQYRMNLNRHLTRTRLKYSKKGFKFKGKGSRKLKKAILLTNVLINSPYKRTYLNALEVKTTEKGNPFILPRFKYRKRIVRLIFPELLIGRLEEVKQIIADTTFSQLIDSETDWALMRLKKFVFKHLEDVNSKTKLKFHKKTKIREIAKHYPLIANAYPDIPWLRGFDIVRSDGRPIDIDKRWLGRKLKTFGHLLGRTLSIENIVPSIITLGLTVLSVNPFVSAISGVISRDLIYAKRYQHNILDYMAQNTPRNILSGLTLASGFVSGKLLHAVYVGAAKGARQSAVTGQPILAGSLFGAVTGGIAALLPPALSNPLVSGMDKNLENALLEFTLSSAKAGAQGYIVSLYSDGNTRKGAINGVVYGLGYTGVVIGFRGFKYDPTPFVTEAEIEDYLNGDFGYSHSYFGVSHNELMADRAYDGRPISLSMNDIRRLTYRKESPWRKLFDPYNENYYRSNYFSVTRDVSMGIGREEIKRTIIHEAVHDAQFQHLGYMVFMLKGLLIHHKLFEDYESVVGCGCLDNWFPF